MPLHDFRSVHLPYCLKKQSDGKYIVLNREYKPIGFKTRDRVDYEKYPIAVKFKRFTAKTAATLSWSGSANVNSIFLYNDGCVPTKGAKNMRDYLKKLEILAKLRFAYE